MNEKRAAVPRGGGRVAVALAAALLVLAAGGFAQAQRADGREAKARQLFALGRYTEALEIYAALYAETTHPTYIRNIGRCYQNLGEPDKAISSFREYLRKVKSLTAPQREEVERFIAEMEALKRSRKAEEEEAARPRPPPSSATKTAEAPAAAEARKPKREAAPGTEARQPPRAEGASTNRVASEPSPSGERGGGGRRIAGVVVAGASAGVAALAVGTYFALRARSKLQASNLACRDSHCSTMDGVTLNNEAKSAARVADFLIGGGLVAAAVATYLLVTVGADGGTVGASGGAGAPAASSAPSPRPGGAAAWARGLQIVPELGSGGAALAVGGTF